MRSPLDYFRVLGLVVLKGFRGYRRVFKVLEEYCSTFYYVEILELNYNRYEAGTVPNLKRY